MKSIKLQIWRKLLKLIRVPTPVELGWSSSNALPIKKNKSNNDFTWDDWDTKMKKKYPIKYFLSETLPSWYRRKIYRPFDNLHYIIVSHIVPSRRYHMLDLRQPKNKEKYPYRWGWVDSDKQIVYALFNILNNFVEKELPSTYCPSEEELLSDPSLAGQRVQFLEIKSIHYWWNVLRHKEANNCSNLLQLWHAASQNNTPDTHDLWEKLQKAEHECDLKEDEMIARLMKIRRTLWS